MYGTKWITPIVAGLASVLPFGQAQASPLTLYRLPVAQIIPFLTNAGPEYHPFTYAPRYIWVRFDQDYKNQMKMMEMYEWAGGIYTLGPRGWVGTDSGGSNGISLSLHNPIDPKESLTVSSYSSLWLSDIAPDIAAVFPYEWPYLKAHAKGPVRGLLGARPKSMKSKGYQVFPMNKYDATFFRATSRGKAITQGFFGWYEGKRVEPTDVKFSISYDSHFKTMDATAILSFFSAFAQGALQGKSKIW